jgi:hypothetical protein
MAEEEKIPAITTSNTSGLASVLQLIDDTPNEVFMIRHSTSGTETVLVLEVTEPDRCRDGSEGTEQPPS